MGQEFVIKSQNLEDKINQLLPSQGGSAAGVDLSASTTIIPIVDLTESAEGSNLRSDLQTAYGINSEYDDVSNTTTTIINTTGYYRLLGYYRSTTDSGTTSSISITDGISTNTIQSYASNVADTFITFDFNIFLAAGDSCVVTAGAGGNIRVASRQIATINGDLVNPS